jgi:hypothetical protein
VVHQYADPDLLNPPLPEPYRSIDIIVRSIIDDAMTLIVKKDEAERASKGWQTAKPCYPTSLVSGLGVVTVPFFRSINQYFLHFN